MATPRESLRAFVRSTLEAALERSGLEVEQVALRAGVHPRTVQRALDGEACDVDSADRVARVLGVRWR